MNQKTTSRTMVVIQPPPDQWKEFVEIKKNHMNPRIKRPPFPHCTLLHPFLLEENLEDAEKRLVEAFKDFEPFELNFSLFKIFDNNKSSTLYLHPETPQRVGAVNDVFNILKSIYPNCIKHQNFRPHIGVGFWRGKNSLKKAKSYQRKYQQDWKNISFLCKEIYIISRVSNITPFQVRKVIPFKGETKEKAYFEEIELVDKEIL